jgi:hypothetical protein
MEDLFAIVTGRDQGQQRRDEDKRRGEIIL